VVIEHPHGVLAIVDDVISVDSLHPDEIARAEDFREIRRASFIAGRSALSVALAALGLSDRPSIGSDDRGAPLLPPGYVGSVSHKGGRAVALVAEDEGFDLGVDVERAIAPRQGIERMVLTEIEQMRVRDPLEIIASFSLKEAIYKAIDPSVKRYVGFHEVEVMLPALSEEFARAEVSFGLKNGESIATIETTVAWIGDFIITTARAKRG
jgi:4'-phosphopantetheinyl transferase EntD